MNKENTIKNIERLKEILIFVLLSICLILPVIRQVTHTLIFSLNNECNIIKFIGLIGIIGLVLSICINYKKNENKKEYILKILPIILFVLYMTWTLISCILSQDQYKAFYGTDTRKDGYFTYIAYAGIFSLALCLKDTRIKKVLLNLFILIATLIIALVEIRKQGFLSTLIWTKDITKGPFFNSNHYGYYLMMVASIALFLFIMEDKKVLKMVYLLIYSYFIYYLIINNTFGSYLALFLTIVMFMVVAIIKKEKRILALISIIIFAGISICTQTAKNINTQHNKNITSENIKQLSSDISKITNAKNNPNNKYEEAGSGRLALWINGTKFFIESPVFGYGPENLEVKYKEVGILQDRPHNLILQLLTTSGLPGCILYMSAVGIILIRGLKNIDMKNDLLVVCLFTSIAYLISSMFGNSMYYTSPYFYIILGFLMKELIEKEGTINWKDMKK